MAGTLQRAQSGAKSSQFLSITIPAGGWTLGSSGITTFKTGTNAATLSSKITLGTTNSLRITPPSGTYGLSGWTSGSTGAITTLGGEVTIVAARVDTVSSVSGGVITPGVIAIDIMHMNLATSATTVGYYTVGLTAGQVIQVQVTKKV